MMRYLLLVGLLLGTVSCREEPPHSLSWRTTPRALEPGRVAILPVWSAPGVGRSAASLTASLAASWRELALHEVVLVPVEERKRLVPDDVLRGNTISSDDLLRLRDALHCDAVLFTRIDQFDSFDPVAIGIAAHLISCYDGEKLWEAVGHFDASRSDIQDDLRAWHRDHVGEGNGPLAGWKSALSSPALFSRYVTDRLAGTVIPPKD